MSGFTPYTERLWQIAWNIVTSVTQRDRSSGRPYYDYLIIVYLLRVRCKWHQYRDFSSFVKFFRSVCKQNFTNNNSNQKYFLCPELFIAVNFTSLPQTLPSLSGVFFQSYVIHNLSEIILYYILFAHFQGIL